MIINSFLKNNSIFYLSKKNLIIIDEGNNFPVIGGNKVRKIFGILGDENYDGLLTYGSKYSSHCIAVAFWGMKHNIPVRLLIIEDDEIELEAYPTIKLSKFFGATVQQINSLTATEIINKEKELYSSYKWISGGGHEYGGLKAYSKWFTNLLVNNPEIRKRDWIILPYGTGTTALGILDAINNADIDMKVIGVSVSRSKEKCYKAAKEFLSETALNNLNIIDKFKGQYGLVESKHKKLRLDFMKKTGILPDPIYNIRTIEYLSDNRLTNGIILNTGGQHNNYL